MSKRLPDDRSLSASTRWSPESLISAVLRGGVVASVILILFGTLVSFIHHPAYLSSPETLAPLTSPGAAPSTLAVVIDRIAHFRGQGIVALGLLLLLATPLARVSLSILLFARERDRRFTAITSLVLALLLVSFVLGNAGG